MENQLHLLMGTCKKVGMKNALWAALTPTLRKLGAESAAQRASIGTERDGLGVIAPQRSNLIFTGFDIFHSTPCWGYHVIEL